MSDPIQTSFDFPLSWSWRGWAAVTERDELIAAFPGDVYEAKHAAMNYEHEHGVKCHWVEVVIAHKRSK